MRTILVGSGKGGVGKSTTAAALALYFQRNGFEVGLLDADLAGPSLPVLLGYGGPVRIQDGLMLPVLAARLKCMSTGFLAPADRAVVWSGAMLDGALWQMLHQTRWSPIDLMVVDLPPGTNELHIRIAEEFGSEAAVVLVSSEDPLSVADTTRALDFFLELQLAPVAAAITPVGAICPQCAKSAPREKPVLSIGGYVVPTVLIPALGFLAAPHDAAAAAPVAQLTAELANGPVELSAALAQLARLAAVRGSA